MENCLYVHPDNIDRAKKELSLKIAVIARPSWYMTTENSLQIIVETYTGVHTRCFIISNGDYKFLLIYGRFDRIRGTSADIDYKLTQDVINFLGIKIVIGMFVAGSIKDNDKAPAIYIPHDFIGFGNYNISCRKEDGFRNVDMLTPFCPTLRDEMINSSKKININIIDNATYACFHGFPRIETRAELIMYNKLGCDIVGQTLDPEATLARESGCHYAAIVSTIDDYDLRSMISKNIDVRHLIDENILIGRKLMFNIFLQALPSIHTMTDLFNKCACESQGTKVKSKSKFFYYRPDYLLR